MKSKSRKLRERAERLGKKDPTLTSGVSRTQINEFYKKGSSTPSVAVLKRKEERKLKSKIKSKYESY